MERGLLYWTSTAAQLVGYTNVDSSSIAADRRSTSGYAFSLCSAAIAWSSKKQPREQERSGRHRDTELDDEFDFRSAEKAEGGSTEESESGRKGSNRKKEPKTTRHGGDDAIQGGASQLGRERKPIGGSIESTEAHAEEKAAEEAPIPRHQES